MEPKAKRARRVEEKAKIRGVKARIKVKAKGS